MVTGVNIAIDVGQALFSDCPLRGSIMAIITGILQAATFGAGQLGGFPTVGAAADAITGYALSFLNYEC